MHSVRHTFSKPTSYRSVLFLLLMWLIGISFGLTLGSHYGNALSIVYLCCGEFSLSVSGLILPIIVALVLTAMATFFAPFLFYFLSILYAFFYGFSFASVSLAYGNADWLAWFFLAFPTASTAFILLWFWCRELTAPRIYFVPNLITAVVGFLIFLLFFRFILSPFWSDIYIVI